MPNATPCVSDNYPVVKTIAVTFASINDATDSTVTLTVPGVRPGMVVRMNFDALLDAGVFVMEQPVVTAVDTLKFRVRNNSGGTLTPAAVNAYIIAG